MRKKHLVIAVMVIATGAIATTLQPITSLPNLEEDVTGEDYTFDDGNNKSASSTDITSTYIKNPSFEDDDISSLTEDSGRKGSYTASSVVNWTLSGSYGVSDIMTDATTVTDNNFGDPGTPSDGDQMYYIRYAWKVSTPSLLQSVTLPAGNYKLTVDNKCITTAGHTAYLVAGSES